MALQSFRRRSSDDDAPALVVDSNVALFGMVVASVLILWAINRGFRGFVVNS